ncbi:MAG: NAD(P)/FAD-dependent oxidoreductase [Helicobacter sp.]|nr:NAD(P)/FAD-dependent oxidoreductase [Helicobacter sp.]
MQKTQKGKKRILIVGGGYGGLKTAITLQKRHADAEIILISKHDYHYQTTLLHKVAIGTLSEQKAKIYYRTILKSVKFIKDKVMEIKPEQNLVIGKFDNYNYDILVIALGFKPNFFDIKGAKEHTYKLTSLNAALLLKKHIEWKFKDFHITKDLSDLSFIVCGTGFTSIEFAAELAHSLDKLCQMYGLDKSLVKITCIGRSDRILPVFPPDLAQNAAKKLEDLGVTFINNADVIECTKDGVILQKKAPKNNDTKEIEKTEKKAGPIEPQTLKITGNITLWGTGVKGSDIIEHYSKINSTQGRMPVDTTLKSIDYENIYVVGDCATSKREMKFVPTAQLATQMGEYLGNLLADELSGKTQHADFKFINRGSICSLGHLDATGVIFGRKINGEFGAFMKNLVENRWLFGIGGLKMVIRKGQFRYRSSD